MAFMKRWSASCALVFWLAGSLFGNLSAAPNQSVLTDGLQNGWQNWSWAQIATTASPAHSGASAWSVTADAWEAAYFHHDAVEASLYTNLTLWVHGGPTGGQLLLVQGISNGQPRSFLEIPALAANTWRQVSVSMEQLGVAGDPGFDGFWVQDRSGKTQAPFFLDEITLLAGTAGPGPTNAAANVVVDAEKNRRPISDQIYGVAFASEAQLRQLNVRLNRSGGNAESRYNWELNAHNRGFDWFFQSLADASSVAGAETDSFIASTRAAGAEPMVTVPMLGWAAKLGPNRGKLASFSIAKYGAQTSADWQWFPDAGNGILASNNRPITGNDPHDANLPVDSAFQKNWVRHLTNRWGPGAGGGVRFYMMDNEPSLWHSTHRDVFKTGLRMTELRDRFVDYAAKVRAVDPGAIIVGPEEWGWSGYIFSGYDQQWGSQNGWGNLPDRAANGGMEYLPWFLDQMRQHEQRTGQRLLDIFTVHYYPQGGEYSSDVSSATQRKRNRSTRSLWDPNYTDETWINDQVRLIPRLRAWVNQYYPGLKIGITEYSWGADDHINGATAQADILGIFGREGLDVANRWVVPATGSPAFKAMQMYRNYDGLGSTFGETSVSAQGPNPDELATFASVRASDGALTVMAINKATAATPMTLNLTNFSPQSLAGVWQLNSSNRIARLPDLAVTGATLSLTVPAQSVTLFVLPSSIPIEFGFGIRRLASGAEIKITGAPGACQLQKSIDLASWSNAQSVVIGPSASATVEIPAAARAEFFRVTRE